MENQNATAAPKATTTPSQPIEMLLDKQTINILRQYGDAKAVHRRMIAKGYDLTIKAIEWWLRQDGSSKFEYAIREEFTLYYQEIAQKLQREEEMRRNAMNLLGLPNNLSYLAR